jgi:hypothetical protein
MKSFDKLLLAASLALAAYAAYTLVAGLLSGALCYQSNCVHRGKLGENFVGYAFMYGLVVAFGLVSAWRSHKNIRTARVNQNA